MAQVVTAQQGDNMILLTPELEAILDKFCELNEKSLQQIKLIKEIKKEFPKCKENEKSN